ncbi:hypothetical protein Nepgr_013056 [Nepenthes gracilis]|uniref:Uncharacterized protein n=1 Tax=Nepenthes gracilis TaxID=150966 RepID=A0AAD3SI60_NEPGR|nr:hypothetical protein Nepgr_013056 [Nepenthes gracilis]
MRVYNPGLWTESTPGQQQGISNDHWAAARFCRNRGNSISMASRGSFIIMHHKKELTNSLYVIAHTVPAAAYHSWQPYASVGFQNTSGRQLPYANC